MVGAVRVSVNAGRRWQVQWCLRAAARKKESNSSKSEYRRCGPHDELAVMLLTLIVEGRSGLSVIGRHLRTSSGTENVYQMTTQYRVLRRKYSSEDLENRRLSFSRCLFLKCKQIVCWLLSTNAGDWQQLSGFNGTTRGNFKSSATGGHQWKDTAICKRAG